MNDFKKYNSIENGYRTIFIDKVKEQGLNKGLYSVSEKADGANLSFLYNGEELRVAKRSSLIGVGGSFYNVWSVYDKYESKIKEIFETLNLSKENNDKVIVYGELLGQGIQRRIFYSPIQDFYGFDIKVNGSFLSIDEKNAAFEKCKIPHAIELFRGTFDECMDQSYEFDSIIPKLLGNDHKENNICEGVVVQPIVPAYLPNGSRIMIKNKNKKFSEKMNIKSGKIKNKKSQIVLTPEGETAQKELYKLLNDNRIHSAISKIGEITSKDFGKLLGMVISDILEDYLKDNKETFILIKMSERNAITKMINRATAELIRENFLNIIDGVF